MDITQTPLLFIALFFASFIGLIISVYYIVSCKGKNGYLFAPLSLFLDIFLFYVVLLIEIYGHMTIIGGQQLLIWSGVARLHALLVVLTYLVIEPKRSG
jgi:hypothetical protein